MIRILKFAVLGVLVGIVIGTIVVLVQVNRRPAIEQYPLAVRAATGSPVIVRFAGVATLVFDDGETAWMTDGFFSRPSYARVVFTKIEPDRGAIERGLKQLGVTKLAAVVPVHSHYDHAMDSPVVARQTGAMLIGSESTLNVGRGLGMPEARMRKVVPNESLTLGKWKLTFIESKHVPLPFKKDHVDTIDKPLVPPVHALKWGEGMTWAIHIEHASGSKMLVLGSAGLAPGSLKDRRADTVFLGVGSAGKQTLEYRTQWWDESVRKVGARRVVPIHWDDFGRGLDEPLVAFPYLIDDVGATMVDLNAWAKRDGIELRMPPTFTPFAP